MYKRHREIIYTNSSNPQHLKQNSVWNNIIIYYIPPSIQNIKLKFLPNRIKCLSGSHWLGAGGGKYISAWQSDSAGMLEDRINWNHQNEVNNQEGFFNYRLGNNKMKGKEPTWWALRAWWEEKQS